MKYGAEKIVQRDLVYNVVGSFPNFWVRKLIFMKGNRLIKIFFFRAQR